MIRPLTSAGLPAMVVFVDHTECAWLQPLKRGFRHCFVALEHPSGWLVCDSLKSHMEIMFLELSRTLDLSECYAEQGHHVLVGLTAAPAPLPRLTLAPLTCVSVAKRLLAIQASWVWTPWQLFRVLSTKPHGWRLVSHHGPGRDCRCRATIEA